MALHVAHGLALQPPPRWDARVTEVFAGAPDDGFAPHALVTRDTLDDGDDLDAYVDREAAKLARRLPRFALTARQTRDAGGARAIELAFTWADGMRAVSQRQLYVATPSRRVAALTVTTASEAAERHGAAIDALFASVRAGR